MRCLSFSVLVIFTIGLFAVPGAFADHDSDEPWGTIHVDPAVLELPHSAWDDSEYEKDYLKRIAKQMKKKKPKTKRANK